jgi:hypothetical protein
MAISVLFGTPVKGVINDLGNVIRRPQQHQEDRRGGGAYRYTHGRSERPGVCGARFRRHAEHAGCPPGAAASGSTHRYTTAATASTTAGPTAGESTAARRLLALRWHRQFLSVRKVLGCVNAAPVLSVDRIHPQESNPASLN